MAMIVSWLIGSLFIFAKTPSPMSCYNLFSAPVVVRGAEEFEKHPDFFRYLDRSYSFKFEAAITDAGIVFFEASLNRGSLHIRSPYSGRELYAQMIEHFGAQNIIGISGVWMGGTNLSQYYLNRQRGDSPELAAAQTWSGRLAAEYGFTHVHVVDSGDANASLSRNRAPVEVIFLKKNDVTEKNPRL